MNNKGTVSFFNLASILQILIFVQSLLYAAVFGLMTHSELNAIYGFMIGSVSTTIAVVYQCHKNNCLRNHSLVRSSYGQYRKIVFWLSKPLLAGLVFFFYIPPMG
jgi:hypothetical protein